MNRERWASLFTDTHNPPWHMDWRHVEMIHAVLCHELPASVVEIGTYRGASTSAIVEAMEAYPEIAHATLVDYAPQIAEWVTATVKDRVEIFVGDSALMHGQYAGCWIIDGGHELEPAKQDLHTALKGVNGRIIIVHDTRTAAMGVGGHDGAAFIAQYLSAAHQCFSDDKMRDGELTHRGLLIAFVGMNPKSETLAALAALQ